MRLDVWLDVGCLFKTRSEAQRACREGKVRILGVGAKPHRLVKPGDELRIDRGHDRIQIIVVRALAEHHIARSEARALYDDRTPPPAPEQVEARRIDRLIRSLEPQSAGAPDKRQRRELRRLKGRL